MKTYTIPANLLQDVINILNKLPAGEVFMLMLKLKELVESQHDDGNL